jgi:hypothetical protein
VIGDGKTETIYFESIKAAFKEKLTHCALKPDLPRPATVAELRVLIDRCASYDKVLCIIDMDTKLREKAEMAEYRKLKRECLNDPERAHVRFFETHPCTELWFYYYFEHTTQPLDTYESSVKELIRTKIPGYEKKPPFCSHLHICKCGGVLDNAITHGRKSMKSKVSDLREYTYSDMANFFEEIGIVPPEPPKKRLGKKKQ